MAPLELEEDRKRVANRIAEIEKETAGEIVVRVVDKSEDYAFFRLSFAAGGAVAVAEGLSLMLPESARFSLELALGLGVAFWLLLGWSYVLRRVLPAPALARAVHRRAQIAFMEDGVYRTRDASGVLVFISRFEHRVEILADAGIHARVGVEGWSRHVETILSGIKAGEGTRGLLEALDAIGAELKTGFPPRPDDTDELSNHVIVTPR